MTLQMVLVLAITVIVFSGFIRERQPPDVTALLGVCLLLIFGALSADDFLSVFANGAPITIGAIFFLLFLLLCILLYQMICLNLAVLLPIRYILHLS